MAFSFNNLQAHFKYAINFLSKLHHVDVYMYTS